MVVLRYFDPLNFAQDIRCPSLVGLSRKDEVVPPETVLAMVAHLRAPYELMWFPIATATRPRRGLDGVREALSRPDLVRLARSLPA